MADRVLAAENEVRAALRNGLHDVIPNTLNTWTLDAVIESQVAFLTRLCGDALLCFEAPPVGLPDLLTREEHRAMDLTAALYNTLCKVAGDGPTRDWDLAEIAASIHHIQHAVLAQAAARAYPSRYRLMGQTMEPRVEEALPGTVDLPDLVALGEEVGTAVLGPYYDHPDGRTCGHHNRLRLWTPDGRNQCLRDHPEVP